MTDLADDTNKPNTNTKPMRGTLPGRLYLIVPPRGESSPEQLFQALHGLLRPAHRRLFEGQPWISLELTGVGGEAKFFVWIPIGQESFVEDLFRAAYPGVELRPADTDPLGGVTASGKVAVSAVGFSKGNNLPINSKFDGDSLAPLLSTLARPRDNERIHISILVRPKPNGWQANARAAAHRIRKGGGSFLAEAFLPTPREKPSPTPHQLDQAKSIEEKASKLGFDCIIRVVAIGHDEGSAREYLRAVAGALRVFDGTNGFAFKRPWNKQGFVRDAVTRKFSSLGGFVMNTAELAALYHLPLKPPPHVEVQRSLRLPAPPNVPTNGRTLGLSTYGGHDRPVAQRIEDARIHTTVLGGTGTGKTTLLANLALADIEAGRSAIVLDPKGDLVSAILERVPIHRQNDVVVISSENSDLALGLNPLRWEDPDERELVADNLLAIFRRTYHQGWGPRTDDLLKSALLTLTMRPDSTLCEIVPLLSDQTFRSKATAQITDPILRGYWRWFDSQSGGMRNEIISPFGNKLRDLLLRPRIRRLICQPHSTVDLDRILNGRGILLANLATGLWGETTAALLGSFLMSMVWTAARRRAAVPEDQRADAVMYVDEWHRFVGISGSFADALAEARSLRLSLVLATQHLGQLPKKLKEAVSSNARSHLVFQCGQEDARYLSREFAPLGAEALQALPRFEIAARLAVDGETSRPFTFQTQPLRKIDDPELARRLAETSLSKHGRPVSEIDREIERLIEPYRIDSLPEFGLVGRRPRA